MLKFCLAVALILGFSTNATAATCIMREYKIKALWQFFVIQIYDRPDGSGVYSPQWEDWNTYPSDGSLIDEIVAWEGVRSSLEFLGFYDYPCPDPNPDEPDPNCVGNCCDIKDCCEVSCLECLDFDLEKYAFLIPFFDDCDEEECPNLNLRITGTILPARRGTARITGDWCKSLGCDGSYNKFLKTDFLTDKPI